ncbi:hypothetical protein [Halorubellus litoreus]|uniref:Uncharacterized protein n=1 Tax=Halorubellus litoreus TaxID=755308 RepID=A0ABD5VNR8_9EURY
MRVENLVPGFVARRVPDRPEWVASNARDPRTAARVYGAFAFVFTALLVGIPALVMMEPIGVLWVMLVVVNAAAWAWALWWVRIPDAGAVSRRNALWTGLGIGSLSWLTVGPLLSIGYTVGTYLGEGTIPTLNIIWNGVAYGVYYTIGGYVLTLGIPTVASVALALWTLDYEDRSGRERRESNYDLE